jgi:CheY-like chemotaxis protein
MPDSVMERLAQAAGAASVPLVVCALDRPPPAVPLPASRARLRALLWRAMRGEPLFVPTGALPAAQASGALLRGRRILLAEDNETNRAYIRALLERAGCTVATAMNGRAVVHRALEESFDLILMDIQMPELDGLAAASRIRDALGSRTPPIVALTAHAQPDDHRRSRAAGLAAHLVKPIAPEALWAALTPLLGVSAAVTGATVDGAMAARGTPERPTSIDTKGPRPAVDFAAGLAHAGGDAKLYHRVLAAFHDEHLQDPARLDAALAVGDAEAAQAILHAIKGVAGLVGAEHLQRAAAAAMASFGHHDDWRPATRASREALAAVLAVLDPVVAAPVAQPPAEAAARLAELCAELDGLLGGQDAAAAAALLEPLRRLVDSGRAGAELRLVERSIAAGRCDEARAALADLRRILAAPDTAGGAAVQAALPLVPNRGP